MPKQKPAISRAVQRVYKQAIADAGERAALLRGDPAAIERAARRRAFGQVEARAAEVPTAQRKQAVRYMKRGMHRT